MHQLLPARSAPLIAAWASVLLLLSRQPQVLRLARRVRVVDEDRLKLCLDRTADVWVDSDSTYRDILSLAGRPARNHRHRGGVADQALPADMCSRDSSHQPDGRCVQHRLVSMGTRLACIAKHRLCVIAAVAQASTPR